MLRIFSLTIGMLLFSGVTAFSGVQRSELTDTFTPLTTRGGEGTRWITIESQLDIPTSLEEHLLAHYTEMWGDQPPESFSRLKNDFDQLDVEKRGYPVVDEDGNIESVAANYWVQQHLKFFGALSNSDIFNRNSVLSVTIDRKKSRVEAQTLHLVYRVRLELEPKSKDTSLDNMDLNLSVPKNLHAVYQRVLNIDPTLKSAALKSLSEGALPQPRLRWRSVLSSVKHACLGQGAVDGFLGFRDFVSKFNSLNAGCVLPSDIFAEATVQSKQKPAEEVKVYPEYQELLRDGKISALIAIQECNDKRYGCVEGQLGEKLQIRQLNSNLKEMGYTITSRAPQITTYEKTVSGTKVEISVYVEGRPVHYEAGFWSLYPRAEVVITNRLPMVTEQSNKSFVPKYQIVMAEQAPRLGWPRLLPHLDYSLLNMDAVDTNVEETPKRQLIRFVENLSSQTSPLTWTQLLQNLEKREGASTDPGSAVAHFVRQNRFQPNTNSAPIDFNRTSTSAEYIALLNMPEELAEDINIDQHMVYLYLTLQEGKTVSDYATLRANLKKLCTDGVTNDDVKNYYFFRGCTPRALLASGRTTINGVQFPEGSYVDLYMGPAGVPKQAYLSATTMINGFPMKAYFEDTAGAVTFYQKNGKVRKGHLAQPIDYKGLPLNGGRGTSALTFYEDGQLFTAQLRGQANYTIGNETLVFQGGVRGPHQVTFHPTGQLASAYLASAQRYQGFVLAGVNAPPEGMASKEQLRVQFHSNGKLMAAVLAQEATVEKVPYPAGTSITLNNQGKIIGPIYQIMGEGEVFWQTTFPAGSLYTVDTKTGNPQWIRLAGPLNLRSHQLPSGTEVNFTPRGSFQQVKAPSNGRPRIVFQDYSISVPENSTLVFSGGGEPSELVFKTPVTIGDYTYSPQTDADSDGGSLRFHESGRVASGILATDAQAKDPHYGVLPLKANTRVRFMDDGRLEAGTLATNYGFTYRILSASERPKHGKHPKDMQTLPTVNLTAGSEFSLTEESKLSSVKILGTVTVGRVRVEAGGQLSFHDDHELSRVSFSDLGGQIGNYSVAGGKVRFYENGQPTAFVLRAPVMIGNINVPAGSSVSFYENGNVNGITAEKQDFVVDVGGRRFTKEVAFHESGNVRQGYLYEDVTYNSVKIASLARCRSLKFLAVDQPADSCAVTFYEDGKSFMTGISAEAFTINGKQVSAGQDLEFLENGQLFIE